jgi:predicted house-cleaning NTP pyrophosphatase (Maf/HAM1 superfamily)
MKEQTIMIFSFTCPVPCNHEIKVDAKNDDDASIKLMTAGALRCRNAKYLCHCEKTQRNMSQISEEKLKKIVRTCMQEEHEEPEGYNGIFISSYESASGSPWRQEALKFRKSER